jgi:hypothetical protein
VIFRETRTLRIRENIRTGGCPDPLNRRSGVCRLRISHTTFWASETDSPLAFHRGWQVARPKPLPAIYAPDSTGVEISKFFGDRRDAEMKEISSLLRRRPDGRSLGFVHDYLWQAAALILGTRPLSQAEFEAIVARLERSCRTFERGPGSRNYVATLRSTIGHAIGHG